MAWKGCLDDLIARGLRALVLVIIDGNAGLRRAVGEVWARAAVQRCCVHKLRNLERKAPKHALLGRGDESNVIERLHEEFRRRVKTQGSLPSEDAAPILLFSLVVSGQIKLRRIDGWRKIAAVLTERTSVAA
jgi:transposase-like protein